jgi:transcriptional regulator with XRE-family HTH domain
VAAFGASGYVAPAVPIARSRPVSQKILVQLGRRIRVAREAARLTQEDAASRVRMDYKRWQKLEAGAVNPTFQTLHRIALGLGTTVWKLLGPIRRSPSREAEGE